MVAIDPQFEYIELAVDSFDATAPGGQLWRNSSSPANQLVFSWPKYYWSEKSPDIIGLKVISAEIPNVWDVISLGNNTFVYTVGGVPNTITIAVGTYTGAALATALQTAISAISGGFTVTWNATTSRFTFTQALAVAWSLSFPTKATLYMIIGFVAGSTNSATGAGSAITSSVIANLTGPYYVYLNSRILGPLINFNIADGNAAASGGPQICRIPVNVNKNAVIFYTDPNPEVFFDLFSQDLLNSFDLYLSAGSDQEQTPLDMKGVPWSVKLGLVAYRQATRDLTKKPNKRGITSISQ